jgi:hypothetical protein
VSQKKSRKTRVSQKSAKKTAKKTAKKNSRSPPAFFTVIPREANRTPRCGRFAGAQFAIMNRSERRLFRGKIKMGHALRSYPAPAKYTTKYNLAQKA